MRGDMFNSCSDVSIALENRSHRFKKVVIACHAAL